MELSSYGSERTPILPGLFFLGGVMLHSDQSFPGTPEQPCSTAGTGPSDKTIFWSVCKWDSRIVKKKKKI